MDPIRLGDRGAAVAEVRSKLAQLGLLPAAGADNPVDAVFDAACDRAVRGFQQSRGLSVDGCIGPETYRALEEAHWRLGDRVLSFRPARPYVGDDVADLQVRLIELGFDAGRGDGIFGPRTEQAVRDFQRNVGLIADGTCGPSTFEALRRLRRTVGGGTPHGFRESEDLRRAGPALAGKFVVIDPGHGGADTGHCARAGASATSTAVTEAAIADDVATRLEGRLSAIGAYAVLSRGPEICPSEAERAEFANAAEADLLISLHTDWAAHEACNGVATYYFGVRRPDGTHVASAVGRRLAGLVSEEVVTRTDLLDCRAHAKAWDLLRLTRMPAVRVELGYLSNPGDATRLASAQFRDTLADALVVAMQRLYAAH